MAKNVNGRIGAEVSCARTHDRTARTRPARETFLKRFEKEVDPDGTLPPEERRERAEHAKRAYSSRNDRLPHVRRDDPPPRARHRAPELRDSGADFGCLGGTVLPSRPPGGRRWELMD